MKIIEWSVDLVIVIQLISLGGDICKRRFITKSGFYLEKGNLNGLGLKNCWWDKEMESVDRLKKSALDFYDENVSLPLRIQKRAMDLK